jgi:hypothetical protein
MHRTNGKDPSMSFCVTVLQSDRGTSLWAARTALVTSDLKLAIETAQHIEDHGYYVALNLCKVVVTHQADNHLYKESDFEITTEQLPKTHPVIYIRERTNFEWQEEWYQESWRKKFLGEDEKPAAA